MYSLDDLRELMRYLRDPDHGCPWDLKQSYITIAPHTLEECFELVDAIESGDTDQICQELGDVLFQVVFYSQLAEEAGDFRFADAVDGIVKKLLRRHPHVFPEGLLQKPDGGRQLSETQIKHRWEQIKTEERAEKAQNGVLDDIPLALPSLSRAQKLQKRAAGVGFDWSSSAGVLEKLDEERRELADVLQSGTKERQAEELGDLLFTVVNLARHLELDAETLLRAANRKFETRFRLMEAAAGKTLSELDSSALDVLWEQVKRRSDKAAS